MELSKEIKRRFGIIGNATELDRAIEIAIRVAQTDVNVLIMGENGSGKESFAKIIHALSTHKHGKFISVNCGAIPQGTLESELFGHEKGAFTGAEAVRKGYFEEADGGTLFLDEIGEMHLSTQPKLLRVLENNEFMRVGSSKKQTTTARVLTATNLNLLHQVTQGKFREDLYYRVAQITIKVPPLRERGADIVLLFRKFALDFADQYRTAPIQLTEEAQGVLMKYPFPGNVRQLRNITYQLSLLEKDHPLITPDTLQKYLPNLQSSVPSIYVKKPDSHDMQLIYKVVFEMQRDIQELKKLMAHNSPVKRNELGKDYPLLFSARTPKEEPRLPGRPASDTRQPAPAAQQPRPQPAARQEAADSSENLSLAEQEKELIQKALDKHGYRKDAAAELGISERTLYRKLKELRGE